MPNKPIISNNSFKLFDVYERFHDESKRIGLQNMVQYNENKLLSCFVCFRSQDGKTNHVVGAWGKHDAICVKSSYKLLNNQNKKFNSSKKLILYLDIL